MKTTTATNSSKDSYSRWTCVNQHQKWTSIFSSLHHYHYYCRSNSL